MQASIAVPERTGTGHEDAVLGPVRLRGGVLLSARLAFILLVVLSAYFTVGNVMSAFEFYDEQVGGLPSPEMLRQGTHEAGLSEKSVEYFGLLSSLINVMPAFGLAFILFAKRSNEVAPLLVAVFLVAHSGAVFPPILADMWDSKPIEAALGSIVTTTWITSFYLLFFVFPEGHIRPRWLVVPPALFFVEILVLIFIKPNSEQISDFSVDIVVLPALLLFALYAQFYNGATSVLVSRASR